MRRVVVYEQTAHPRSRVVCHAMMAGLMRCGVTAQLKQESQYRQPEFDVAIFYGLAGNLARVLKEYREAGRKAVYIDLGYWARRPEQRALRYHGYHKVAVNSRHPTEYFRRIPQDNTRAADLRLSLKPWRPAGQHILIAGMARKAAEAEGFRHEEWERRTIAALRQHTDRPIVYRPKPSCEHARPLPSVGYSSPQQPLEMALMNCHAVVTHHSNVGIDALLEGVPIHSEQGAAAPMGISAITMIDQPIRPADRQQWLNDLTWCQWNIEEMAKGHPWLYLIENGLV